MYFDTSVLVACYTEEARSDEASALVAGADIRYVSDLAVTEFGVTVARKMREGYLTAEAGAAVVARFDVDLATNYRRLALAPRHFLAARGAALASDVPLRTLDALHLAACVAHGLDLVTFDARLAAAAHGFRVRAVP